MPSNSSRRWSPDSKDGLIRSNSHLVEAVLTAACLTLTVLLGLFLIVVVEVARADNASRADAVPFWAAPAALAVAVAVTVLGRRFGAGRGGVGFASAVIGTVIWMVAAVLIVSRMG